MRINGDWTLLHHASYHRDIGVMQLLLKHGADADCTDNLDLTPLRLASKIGCPKAMQLLLEYGANVNKRIHYGWTPLYWALLNRNVEVVCSLLQYVVDIDKAGLTALDCEPNALTRGLEIVCTPLERGADVHARDRFNQTPLKLALDSRHDLIAQLLVKYGARQSRVRSYLPGIIKLQCVRQ